MKMIVSAFEAGSKFGGGVITSKLVGYFGSGYKLIARKNKEFILFRTIRTVLSWLKSPFLHPLFCAYSPTPSGSDAILNFSQTFSLIFKYPKVNFDLVAHDIVVQKRLLFNFWIRRSELKIFQSVKNIYVLSGKDSRLLRRFYGVPKDRIINLFPDLYPELGSFEATIYRKEKYRAIFLGSINRIENYRGLMWFYENIYPHCLNNVEVVCVGEVDETSVEKFRGFKFMGFVESLGDEISKSDFAIAPIIDGAGIKIKVVDSLAYKIPVMGTIKAYEGLGRPNAPFCSNDAEIWIKLINSEIIKFKYNLPRWPNGENHNCE